MVSTTSASATEDTQVTLRLIALITFLLISNSRSRSLYVIAHPSVCLSSATFVHPTQAIEIFGNVSMPFGTSARHPGKILRKSSQGTPPLGELNTRGVAEYSDFGPIERYISETVQDRSKVSINH